MIQYPYLFFTCNNHMYLVLCKTLLYSALCRSLHHSVFCSDHLYPSLCNNHLCNLFCRTLLYSALYNILMYSLLCIIVLYSTICNTQLYSVLCSTVTCPGILLPCSWPGPALSLSPRGSWNDKCVFRSLLLRQPAHFVRVFFIRKLKVEITNWWWNNQLVIWF